MITLILIFLFELGFLFIGYYIGRQQKPNFPYDLKDIAKPMQRNLNKLMGDDLKVGPIRRPSALELNKRNEDEKVIAQKNAIKESLDQVPELVKAKEKVKELKQKGMI